MKTDEPKKRRRSQIKNTLQEILRILNSEPDPWTRIGGRKCWKWGANDLMNTNKMVFGSWLDEGISN